MTAPESTSAAVSPSASHDPAVISERGRLYLQLAETDAVGPVRLRSLIRHFGTPEAVLGASATELTRAEGIGRTSAEAIVRSRRNAETSRIIDRCAELGVRVLCQEDDEYPRPLLHISDPPICLFVKGRLEPTDAVGMAIVGTRRCSHYGREQALRFAESLAGAGFTIVSGLARGIDGHAHQGALQAGGRTLAVLGNGLATVYPPEHAELAEHIVQAGALVSELPPDVAPDAKNFPRRNRIIVGLALGVIVVEAGKRSGALISARLAADYNREAFAVPGRIDQPDRAAGVNALIREGHAKLITCLDDVLSDLGDVGRIMHINAPPSAAKNEEAASPVSLFDPQVAAQAVVPGADRSLSAVDQAVLDALRDGATDADRICERAGFDAGHVLASLTGLELRGRIRRLPGNRFEPR